MLRPQPLYRARILIPRNYLDKLLLALGKAEIIHLCSVDEDEELREVVEPIGYTDKYYKYASLASRIEELASNLGLTITPKAAEGNIEEVERRLSEVEEKVNEIRFAISKLEERGDTERIEQLKRVLMEVAEKVRDDLSSWLGLALTHRKIEEAKSKIGKCGEHFYVISAWVPKKRIEELKNILMEATEDNYVMELSEPGHHDHPPTLIKHEGILAPFGALTKVMGTPSYEELDPTPVIVLTFPLIFGFMFGDVGHGLVLTLFSALALYYKVKGVQMGETLNYIIQGSPLLLLCGISSIIFGFLYGEFFGSEEWFDELFKPILHAIGKEHGPIWFSPYHEPMHLLKICIYVAIAHIISGLTIDLINKVKNREFKHAIAGPAVWLWLYGSGAYLFITYGSRIFEVMFNPQIIVPFIIAPFITMLILRSIIEGPSEGLGSSLESFLSSISNTVSYSRILALNMAHTIFAKLPFNFSGTAFIGAFIAFNALILMLESLLSFMHTLRLHLVEWFLKFYKGEGYEFTPFSTTPS